MEHTIVFMFFFLCITRWIFQSTFRMGTPLWWGLRDVGIILLHWAPQTHLTAVIMRHLNPVCRGFPSRDRWEQYLFFSNHISIWIYSAEYQWSAPYKSHCLSVFDIWDCMYWSQCVYMCVCAGDIPVWGHTLSRRHTCVLTIFKNLLPDQCVPHRHCPLYMGSAPAEHSPGTGRCAWE